MLEKLFIHRPLVKVRQTSRRAESIVICRVVCRDRIRRGASLLGLLLLFAFGSLRARVQEDAAERQGGTRHVEGRDRVLEVEKGDNDDRHALHAVTDRVCHRADARENHVGDLLVHLETEARNQQALG